MTDQSATDQSTTDQSITFIGAGNMAMSLVRGLRAVDRARPIYVADPLHEQLAQFESLNVTTNTDNQAAVSGATIIVLAVKPQVAVGVFADLKLQKEQLLISIAAGIPLSALAAWTSLDQPIIRCMPNTPALLGAGMSALHGNDNCTQAQRNAASSILGAAGETLWVEHESALHAVTALSGSGPAYFFQLMESMIDAGVELGLERSMATQLTLQTAYGAALMAMKTADDPATLKAKVTSPGGTTQAALALMTEKGLPDIVSQALAQAAQRSVELANEFSAN